MFKKEDDKYLPSVLVKDSTTADDRSSYFPCPIKLINRTFMYRKKNSSHPPPRFASCREWLKFAGIFIRVLKK